MSFLGYGFRDEGLLETALTTPSYRMDHPDARDNQRLEFLGDAVLGLLAADRLYEGNPGESEGDLTVRRTHMVSTEALCAAAAEHGLTARLRRNRAATTLSVKSKTIADAVEAVIGAAYLDGGLDAAKRIFDFLGLGEKASEGAWSVNHKGDLQIRAQSLVPPRHPVYELLKTTGPAHAPVFTVRVTVEGLGVCEASAGTRRAAEQLAAAGLLDRKENWNA